MVTKVQGALTSDTSAGYPESWWLPAANDIPADYATAGTFFQSDNGSDTVNALGQGYAIMTYGNDQPTAALWYRDNSGGITRQNVYASGVGYWIIRDADDSETGLLVGKLPEPAAKAGQGPNGDPAVRAAIREIPLIIQPRSFNEDGSLFYPADRAFFEGLGDGQLFADNTGLNIPFVPQSTSDIAPIWNPEAFFNTMVVNGNTWPFLEVAPERYRIRLLNAADSRYLNLSLGQVSEKRGQATKAGFVVKRELPFYQIGSDLSLLPQVVRIETGFATPLPGDGSDVVLKYPDCLLPNGKLRKNCVPMVPGTFAEQGLLVGPGERADIVVDFTGLADGDMVVMFNTAPDAPFGGFPDVPADPCTTGQVMMFVVNKSLANPTGDPSTPPSQLVLDSNPGGIPRYDVSTNTRDLALLEEESALICVTIDAVTGIIDLDPNSVPPTCDPVLGSVPFAPKAAVLGVNGIGGGEVQLWDDPIAQESAIGAIETWEFWNWSADAHVIHLDSVMFEVIYREIIGGTGRAVEPWEQGWKDTVISYPGEVTRVKAKFTIPGLYSWHSNIWSHKDNEMGVPYCVGERGVDCPWNLF